jgi:hypothetical protein
VEAGKARKAPEAGTREQVKRRKTRDQVADNAAGRGDGLDTYDSISRAISCSESSNVAAVPELDTILTRILYRQILEDLFGGEAHTLPDVPIVTRAYEEGFMRSVLEGERACVMGAECECMFIDLLHPFVGTEFLIPSEERFEQAQMCVLCCRKVTQQLFHYMLFSGASFRCVIQHYGNIC